jgi:hypothetical protein
MGFDGAVNEDDLDIFLFGEFGSEVAGEVGSV